MIEMMSAQRLNAAKLGRRIAIVIVGTALMTLAAKTQVPFWPVPMTLQVVAVMGFAVLLGPRLATGICLAYLAAGAAGLPVFSGSPERGIGLAYMMGPTGGYLTGFLIVSWLVGALSSGRGLIGQIGAMLAGLVVVYACGLAWLAIYVPAAKLLAAGLLPFLPGDIVKIAVVAVATALLSRTRFNLRALDQ